MVRRPPEPGHDWDEAPVPILVVEVLSDSTRRRDHEQKRDFYIDAGVEEYWIVDPDRASVRVVRRGVEDMIAFDGAFVVAVGSAQPNW